MKKLATVLLAGAGLMVASAAMAADISAPVVVPGPVVVVPPPAAPGYSWTGLYVGAQFGAWLETNLAVHSERVVGQAGFDLQLRENLVVGVVAQAGVANGYSDFTWAVGGRAGVVLGERILLFTTAKLTDGPNDVIGYLVGGGTEIALGRRFSVVGEAGYFNRFGGGDQHLLISGGVNFRFGG